MSVVGQQRERLERNDIRRKMIHLGWEDAPTVAFCGSRVNGESFGSLAEDGPPVDCVVCVEIAIQQYGWKGEL